MEFTRLTMFADHALAYQHGDIDRGKSVIGLVVAGSFHAEYAGARLH